MSTLHKVVDTYRKQLAAQSDMAVHALNTAHVATIERINPKLNKLYTQISDKQSEGEPIPLSWLYERDRLETTKDFISGNIDDFAAMSRTHIEKSQHQALLVGVESGQAQMYTTKPLGIKYTFGIPSNKAILNMVGVTRDGSPLSKLFLRWGSEAADNVAQLLITAVTLGDNPRVVASLIQDALNISRSRALTISRTEMMRAYRDAALETFRANSDICIGWIWSCDLSSRTCAACLSMDQTEHTLDEELDGHPCCRCAKLPMTKPWSEIMGDDSLDEVETPDRMSGTDWFDTQDEAIQRAVLGTNVAFELYKSGTPLKDFVGIKHDKDWGSSIYQKSALAITRKEK